MNWFTRLFFHPTHASLIDKQLYEAREEFISCTKSKEYYDAVVPMLAKRITRLEALKAKWTKESTKENADV